MGAPTNATQRLGGFAARCRTAPMPAAVMEKAGICLLDALGLAIAGRDERTAAAMRSASTRVPAGDRSARLWADGTRVALSDAVTANAVAVHAHFQDDTDHNSWSHPGSLVVPVAVGAGELTGATLPTVLRAIIAGYATMEWLGADEIVARALIARGLRTSPTLGTIGAASAACVALGLDAAQAVNAVGMAACITGATLEPVRCGSDEWRLHNGHAARGGLAAAELAVRGVVGAPQALEGPNGFLRSLAGLAETPARWTTDPDPSIMLGIMAKPWATLGDNMPAAAAAKLLHDASLEARQVRRVSVRMWRPYTEYPGTSFKGPFERTVQAQASTAFAVGAMLVYGRLGYEMALDHRDDPRILDLVAVTTIEPDDAGTHLDATVEVTLDDGSVLSQSARNSPRALVFQDRVRATEVIEERLASAGRPAGSGVSLAKTLFGALDSDEPVPVATLLDRLSSVH
jgi:2-methylcitrate dehydratase PrpD